MTQASKSKVQEIADLRESCAVLKRADDKKAEEIKRLGQAHQNQTEEITLLKWRNKADAYVVSDLNRSRNSFETSDAEKATEIKRLASANHDQAVEIARLKQMNERHTQDIAKLEISAAEQAEEIQRLRRWRLLG